MSITAAVTLINALGELRGRAMSEAAAAAGAAFTLKHLDDPALADAATALAASSRPPDQLLRTAGESLRSEWQRARHGSPPSAVATCQLGMEGIGDE